MDLSFWLSNIEIGLLSIAETTFDVITLEKNQPEHCIIKVQTYLPDTQVIPRHRSNDRSVCL